MRTRSLSGDTLVEVADKIKAKQEFTWGGAPWEIGLHLEANDPFFVLGDNEIPATAMGIETLATFAQIPQKFAARLEPDEQQWLFTSRLQRLQAPGATVYWNDSGLQEIRPVGEVRVRVADLMDSVLGVLPENSEVDRWYLSSEDFRLDVVVPDDYSEKIGGDPAVGDITKGGVRIGQNRKMNLSPYVQPYYLRLACTNGMEVSDRGIKVEARKCSAEQIVSLFGHEISRAFDRVSGDINAFYDLRHQHLGDDGVTAVKKISREAGLPERAVGNLALSFPEGQDDVTMFDVVNHITNAANSIDNWRSSSYRNFQIAGGNQVYSHAQRCDSCLSRIEG